MNWFLYLDDDLMPSRLTKWNIQFAQNVKAFKSKEEEESRPCGHGRGLDSEIMIEGQNPQILKEHFHIKWAYLRQCACAVVTRLCVCVSGLLTSPPLNGHSVSCPLLRVGAEQGDSDRLRRLFTTTLSTYMARQIMTHNIRSVND